MTLVIELTWFDARRDLYPPRLPSVPPEPPPAASPALWSCLSLASGVPGQAHALA